MVASEGDGSPSPPAVKALAQVDVHRFLRSPDGLAELLSEFDCTEAAQIVDYLAVHVRSATELDAVGLIDQMALLCTDGDERHRQPSMSCLHRSVAAFVADLSSSSTTTWKSSSLTSSAPGRSCPVTTCFENLARSIGQRACVPAVLSAATHGMWPLERQWNPQWKFGGTEQSARLRAGMSWRQETSSWFWMACRDSALERLTRKPLPRAATKRVPPGQACGQDDDKRASAALIGRRKSKIATQTDNRLKSRAWHWPRRSILVLKRQCRVFVA